MLRYFGVSVIRGWGGGFGGAAFKVTGVRCKVGDGGPAVLGAVLMMLVAGCWMLDGCGIAVLGALAAAVLCPWSLVLGALVAAVHCPWSFVLCPAAKAGAVEDWIAS